MNIVDRLERMRLRKGLTWEQVGRLLDLSRGMLHYVRSGERNLSDRALSRLEIAEKELGLESEPATDSTNEKPGSQAADGSKARFSDVMTELGRLMETGVTPDEILRRLKDERPVRGYSRSNSGSTSSKKSRRQKTG